MKMNGSILYREIDCGKLEYREVQDRWNDQEESGVEVEVGLEVWLQHC